jgi:amino acid adenylation domain-containing protein
MLCIHHLLTAKAEQNPDAIAIAAPGRNPLSYGRLCRYIDEAVGTLQALGLGRHDCVALVLPQGPEMAVAFLAVATGATCAPLNPAYRANEFAFYLTDLRAKAVLVEADTDSPVRAVAQALAVPIIELAPIREAEAGLFTLTGAVSRAMRKTELAQPSDVALALHTAGTTSQPKLVPLTHINLCTSALNHITTLALEAHDRCLNVMPLFHIHALVSVVLSSLLAGASVVCPPGFSALSFFKWMEQFQPTWYSAAPTIHQAILARAASFQEIITRYPLRFLRSAAAPLPPPVKVELEEVFHAPMLEAYGMTEAAAQITSNPLPPRPRKPGSAGRAAGPEVAIMDATGSMLPPEEIGEIVIRGASVFQGYKNNPVANAEAFSHGWFRTGDLGFLDADGYLFIAGRLKEIINRGGEKIAPREVDERLLQHPAVAQAVTFAVPHAQLGEEIAAAVVLRQHAVATAAQLQAFAATQLADFKVPRHVFLVPDIPRTSTGKVQRIGLADQLGLVVSPQPPPEKRLESTHPRTAVVEALQRIWEHVLGRPQVDVNDNFFQVGGDSILATQLIARIYDAFQVELSFLTFFETPTVASLSERIEEARLTGQHLRAPELQPLPRDGNLSLSLAQQRLWFFEQLHPGTPTYNIVMAIRFQGTLNVEALERSLTEMVRRHEALRTIFATDKGEPFQIVTPAAPFPLSVVDLQEVRITEQEAQGMRLITEAAQSPFDLMHGPLFRATLLRGTLEQMLLFVMHHIISDGWSMGVLLQELATLYTAYATERPPALPVLPIQYADFAHWQRQWLRGEILEQHVAHWKQQLGGSPATLELPTDRPRLPFQTFRGARESRVLPKSLVDTLQQLSQQEGATLFMTLLAAFQTLLYRYTGQDEICVGTPSAGRTRVQLEKLIGFFVNTLVLRTNLAGRPTFRELLQRVRRVTLEAYTHQDLPFEKLVEELHLQRDLSRTPLFQVFFNLVPQLHALPEFLGLTWSLYEIDTRTAKFDLTLYLSETSNGLMATLNYNTDLFDASTISRMLSHFHTLLESIAAQPDQHLAALPLVTGTARYGDSSRGNQLRPSTPFVPFVKEEIEQSLAARFAQQVRQYPQHIAVKTLQHSWTYTELYQRAAQVTHALLSLRGHRAEHIALFCDHDAPMLAGIFGALQAGKTYVPLDPFSPPERLAYMLEDAQVCAVLTNQRHLELVHSLTKGSLPLINLDALDPSAPCADMHRPIAPETLAYILYTSGSTGRPKGVMQNHRNVLHFIRVYTNNLHISTTDRLTLLPTYSFDAAVMDIFGALLNGATLYPFSLKEAGFAPLASWLHTEAITIYHSTPTVYRYFVRTFSGKESFLALRLIVLGGEEVRKSDVDLYKQSFSPPCLLINGLGPTESTVSLQYFLDHQTEITRPGVPVGYPVEDTEILLLDDAGLPTEICGEIAIRSAHLALGYWQQPERTRAVFLPDPTDRNRRIYRTGDMGRILPDGSLEFLGRKDFQVKIRGYRVELGEIEAVLGHHQGVQETVVVARMDDAGEPQLVAYFVPRSQPTPPPDELRNFLKKKLPDYMVPSAFVVLDALPLTSTGKIDRQALPAPELTPPVSEPAVAAPRTPVESMLTAIWANVLGHEKISIDDNFFAVGGHSLLAMQVLARLREALPIDLSPRHIFEHPTIAGLAEVIVQQLVAQLESETVDELVVELEEPTPKDVSSQRANGTQG